MLNLDIPDTEIYTLADPGLDGLIRECQDQPVITFDTETSGLDITRDMPLFWSVAFGERKICLTADTLPAFARVFGDDDKTFVGHNIKYDIHMLANRGIRVRGRWRDTSVMHALLFENEQHALKTVTKKLLGWGWSSFNETFKTKKRKVKGNQKFFIQQASAGMKHLMEETGQEPVELHVGEDSTLTKEALLWYWQHDPSALADYASNDAYGTMKLDQALQELLAKEAIFSAYPDVYSNMLELYIDTEMPFTQVLWGCERRGIFVDQEYLAKTEAPVVARLAEIEREFARKAGRVIKLTSNDALATYLFGPASENCLGLRPRRMTAGGKKGIQKPSVDEEVLKLLVDECVEAELALEHRQLKKLMGTYITKIGSLVGPDQRLHPQYSQDTARCMPAGELVLTGRGYLPVEEVEVGDCVLSHTGKARKVTETSKHAPSAIYRVRLANGLELRTNGEHPYASGSQWAEAQELEVGMPVWVHAASVEEWSPIEGWSPFEVSTWGRVRNAGTGRFIKQHPKGEWGHLKVQLYRYGAQQRGEDRKDFAVHRLVLEAFVGPSELEVRHLNGIAWDNSLGNLAYGTSQENRQDALRHGTMSQRRAGRTKLTEEAVAEIRAAKVMRGDYELMNAKLSWAQVQEIRTKYAVTNCTQKELSQEYGVTQASISKIVRKESWKAGERPDGVTLVDLAKRYGVSRTTIEQVLSGERWQAEDYIEENPVPFFQVPIEAISIEEPEMTYGLTVEVDESHVTGGIVTHNTGRLSSKQPNIQNQPTLEHDKFGIRKSFIPEPGNILLVFDYKALEMRLLAAAATEEPMIEAFRQGRDPHMANASMIFNVPYDDVVEAKKIDKKVKEGLLPESAMTQRHHDLLGYRSAAKTLGFGLVYGMREGKLARDLKITKPEAVELRKKFMGRFPAVERFLKEAVSDAIALNCKSYTYLGRRRHLPALLSRRPLDRFQAERQCNNNAIQGCLPYQVRVLTSKGLLPIGEIPAKGWAWTGSEWAKYVRLSRGKWQRARIHLENGQLLECDTRHKVLVARDHGYEFVEFSDLAVGDRVCLSTALPYEFGSPSPAGMTTDDAYWMGFATGNGHANADRGDLTMTFGNRKQRYNKETQADAYSKYVTELGFTHQVPILGENKITIRLAAKAFRARWEQQGYVWGKTAEFKRVPGLIWQGSLAIRQAFILGLFDADGTTGDCPSRNVSPSLHMAAEGLLREVQLLGRTVGVESCLRGPYGPENRAFRLDFNRAQLSRNLGYGETVRYKSPEGMQAPRFLVEQFLGLVEGWVPSSLSHRTLLHRIRTERGSTSTYMIEEMADAAGITGQLNIYAMCAVVSTEELPFEEETFTLSVDHPSHRFDGEGVIHKNTAADLVRMAMLNVASLNLEDSYSTYMLMQVHDELVFECPLEAADEVFPIIKAAMEHPFPTELSVPIEVDGGRGLSWGTAK